MIQKIQNYLYGRWAITLTLAIFTIAYLLIFPLAIYIGLAGSFIFESPEISTALRFCVISLSFLIPLSIPLSLIWSWSFYMQANYKKALLCLLLPLIISGFAILLIMSLLNLAFPSQS